MTHQWPLPKRTCRHLTYQQQVRQLMRILPTTVLVAVPSTGLQSDLLIGAGCVDSLQTGSILLYEYGRANRFFEAQKAGTLKIKDSTCPAIHAGLIAAEKGLPFMPVRGLIGSDVLRHRMALTFAASADGITIDEGIDRLCAPLA